MNKKFNFRYYLVSVVSLILMILFYYVVLTKFKTRFICFIVMLIVTIVCALLIFKFNKLWLKFLISIFIIMSLVSFNLVFKEYNYRNNYKFDKVDVEISGKIVSNYTYTKSENVKVVIDDVKLYSKDDSLNVKGKLVLYIEPSNLNLLYLDIGRTIDIRSSVNFYQFSEKGNLSQLSNNIVGYSFCKSDSINYSSDVKLNFKEIVHNFVYKKLLNSNSKYANIGSAMIFGDSGLIEYEVMNVFENIGIVHIIAVSGLNISIIAYIISFIMRKLKFNLSWQFAIITVVLSLYMYLCDFSPSVVRASLMSIIYIYSKIRGKPYDRLSTLSFIAMLIIFINPLKLFNYSFILSFSTILAIILIMPKIKKVLDKFFYNGFSSSISLTISVQIGLVFLQLYLFDTMPTFSVLSNVIIVPITELCFILILFCLPFSFLTPVFNILIFIYDKLMSLAINLAFFIGSLVSKIEIPNISFLVVLLYFLCIFISSDYFFEKKRNKIFIVANILVLCAVIQTLLII